MWKEGNKYRGDCPACGTDRTLIVTPGVAYHCHASRDQHKGGDVIGLARHVLGYRTMNEAAFELLDRAGISVSGNCTSTSTRTSKVHSGNKQPESERGNGHSTSRPRGGGRSPSPPQPAPEKVFDPDEFWAKTTYSDEVAALGISEEDAEDLRIGFYRGKLYQALRRPNGEIAGYSAFAKGELKFPAKLIPASGNVVPFKQRA